MKILIVDDNINHLSDMVEVVIEACPQAQVIKKHDLSSALAVAQSSKLDVVIADACLSSAHDVINTWEGMQVLWRAKHYNPEVYAILTSAYFPIEERLIKEEAGFVVLEKSRLNWLDQLTNICRQIRKRTIFLSYAMADIHEVRKLREKLKMYNLRPWVASDDILPGENWEKEIKRHIEECGFFIACLSGHYVDREGWIQKELRWAEEKSQELLPGSIYRIPIRLIPSKQRGSIQIPESLKGQQLVDLTVPSGIGSLITAIHTELAKVL